MSAGRFSDDFILVAVSFWCLFTSPVVYGRARCCFKSSTIAMFASEEQCVAQHLNDWFFNRRGVKALKWNPYYFIWNYQKGETAFWCLCCCGAGLKQRLTHGESQELNCICLYRSFCSFSFVTVSLKSKRLVRNFIVLCCFNWDVVLVFVRCKMTL